MTKDKIPEFAKKTLGALMNSPGAILYSSHETVKKNDVYLMGLNPGGEGGAPLSHNIDSFLTNKSNAYLDECWSNYNGEWKNGESPLQRRICWLLRQLGFKPRQVCASNLIFVRSRNAKDVNFGIADKCWPVHASIIKIVQPKLIIAYGNSVLSPYAYLHNMFKGNEEKIPSEHGNWKIKGFKTSIENHALYVAGLPHLSRYSPLGKSKVVEWLRGKITTT